MARTNMEDTLIADGNLDALARVMGWRRGLAGGQLWFTYRTTQKAGIVADTMDRIVTTIVLWFDSDQEAVAFVEAMVVAQLARRLEDGRIHIVGNEKHVARFEQFLHSSQKGGIESQKRRREKLNVHQTDARPAVDRTGAQADQTPTLPSPFSLSSSAPPLRGGASEGQPPPQIGTTVEAIAAKVPAEVAKEIVEFYRTEVARPPRSLKMPPMILPHEMRSARLIVAMAGGDVKTAKRTIRAFVLHEGNAHWRKLRWAFSLLTNERDFEQATLAIAEHIGKEETQPRTV